jgi:hypothetical protein
MSMVFGADEDRIQLIAIEARVFDDLADLEPDGNVGWTEVKKKVCVPFSQHSRPVFRIWLSHVTVTDKVLRLGAAQMAAT